MQREIVNVPIERNFWRFSGILFFRKRNQIRVGADDFINDDRKNGLTRIFVFIIFFIFIFLFFLLLTRYLRQDYEGTATSTLTITGTKLSPEGRRLTIEIADLKPVMQQSLKFNLKAADGTPIAQEIQHTIHALP